jgi:hypothetical protein
VTDDKDKFKSALRGGTGRGALFRPEFLIATKDMKVEKVATSATSLIIND